MVSVSLVGCRGWNNVQDLHALLRLLPLNISGHRRRRRWRCCSIVAQMPPLAHDGEEFVESQFDSKSYVKGGENGDGTEECKKGWVDDPDYYQLKGFNHAENRCASIIIYGGFPTYHLWWKNLLRFFAAIVLVLPCTF